MSIFERVYMTLSLLPSRAKSEKGASMVEYALLVAGMAIVVAAAVVLVGDKITAIVNSIDIPA